MSSSIASSRNPVSLESFLSHEGNDTGKPFPRSCYFRTQCYSGSYEPPNKHNGRKRRCSGSSEYQKEYGNETIDLISSMSATIEVLNYRVSCLQRLLHNAYGPIYINPTKYTCPAAFCRSSFSVLGHLNRHIRDKKDSTHEALAVPIDETLCLFCSKAYSRPADLVKHERTVHGETYISKLDKYLSASSPPSSPSSAPIAVDDARSR